MDYCASPGCAVSPCVAVAHRNYLNVGSTSMKISTSSQDAQTWFDRGLALMWGFNHEEAVCCFKRALIADGQCALISWGISWALGGNYNNASGLDPAGAYDAAKQAEAHLESATPLERQLVKALFAKHVRPLNPEEAKELNYAFADAMRAIYAANPDNVDIACFFAEALMNLAPWALWTPKFCLPAIPETLELVDVLEHALESSPSHVGLCHLYIHTMELSANPAKALDAANALRKGHSLGHLLHMPSHIDMWVGAYETALVSNLHAVEADDEYVRLTGEEEGFYKFYRMHNMHFVSWAASFDGQFAVALAYARMAQKQLGPQHVQLMLGDMPFGALMLESYAATVWHVLVRFGQWEAILAEPLPTDTSLYPGTLATAYYARGVALAALGRVGEAEAEEVKFKEATQNPALAGRQMSNNLMWAGGRARKAQEPVGVLNVAEEVLLGEIEYRKKNFAKAFDHLREAVNLDQALIYDEPWGWMMPARHALGALLLEQGELKEAETVFRDDLRQYRNNLWALQGLAQCLTQEGRSEEAETMRAEHLRASQRADIKISSACLCARGNSS